MQIIPKYQILTLVGHKNLSQLLLQFCEFFVSWLFPDIAWQSRVDDA